MQCSSETLRYTLVTDDPALQACCATWRNCAALALDTEFMRVSTFYPKLALIQVADDTGITLIDPLGISAWEPFRALLASDDIVKIFHSCSEDLLVFQSALQVLPAPVFDTQIATALLGEGVGMSYQNLVRQRYDVELPKGETRSDWLQRPLTPEQLDYAALDVSYLQQTWRDQQAALRAQGREAWLQEDAQRQQQLYAAELSADFARYYMNFKAAWQLAPRQLAALQALAAWREQRARKRDKPRSWILKDTALFAIAQSMCSNKTQLAAIPDISTNFLRYEGDQVLALLDEARALNEADCPPPMPKPLTEGQKKRLKRAQQLVEAKAQELGLPPEVLGRKRTLQALQYAVLAQEQAKRDNVARELELPDELCGWRGPLLLDDLLALFRS